MSRTARCALVLFGAFALYGCAKRAESVSAAYVSPLVYDSYSCDQIAMEAQRVSLRVQELTGAQNKKATSDAIATGVAVVVFWPAAFLVSGDDAQTAELSRLKGELEALERVAIQKNCAIEFYRPPEPTPAVQKAS
jgi:hypothetical protein